jgi:hypothetical protein
MDKKPHNFNYYFLNKYLHAQPYPGYRQTVVLLIVNKNKTKNNNKFLFIKEKSGFWFLPKGHLVGTNLTDSLFESILRNLESELGLRGTQIFEVKPSFIQKAYIFDFERQRYNKERGLEENAKGYPTKGKVYHLAIMNYEGADEFKVDEKVKVLGNRWVAQDEAFGLVDKIGELVGKPLGYTEESHKFYKRFLEKVLLTNSELERIGGNSSYSSQERLL